MKEELLRLFVGVLFCFLVSTVANARECQPYTTLDGQSSGLVCKGMDGRWMIQSPSGKPSIKPKKSIPEQSVFSDYEEEEDSECEDLFYIKNGRRYANADERRVNELECIRRDYDAITPPH